MVAYPSGGYRRCLGGSRCRGTIVTVWDQPAGETASAAVTVTEGAVMPWKVVEDHGECGPDEPYAVVKEMDGSLEGCHATREDADAQVRSEEHTSELQSLMRISYAVFCLKKKNQLHNQLTNISIC